jgi:hypothetical protein
MMTPPFKIFANNNKPIPRSCQEENKVLFDFLSVKYILFVNFSTPEHKLRTKYPNMLYLKPKSFKGNFEHV